MIQCNVFTDNKYKSLVTLLFTDYIVLVETKEPNQYWKVLNLTDQCQECFYTERHSTWALFLTLLPGTEFGMTVLRVFLHRKTLYQSTCNTTGTAAKFAVLNSWHLHIIAVLSRLLQSQ